MGDQDKKRKRVGLGFKHSRDNQRIGNKETLNFGPESFSRDARATNKTDDPRRRRGRKNNGAKPVVAETATKHRPAKRNRSGPSEEALALSSQLKDLSRQKNLEEALRLYQDPSNQSIVDGHHACIVIDCCARCGRIDQGEKIVKDLESTGKKVNVETKTALIKGYSHSGKIFKANDLFASMCSAKAKSDRPNVRTLNTLLRGCLWSAAVVDVEGNVAGGVVTAEKAWTHCKQLQSEDRSIILFDVSSFEYSIALLCQALRIDDVLARLEDMKDFFGVSDSQNNVTFSVNEALALSYVALARAYAILGEGKNASSACRSFSTYAQAARSAQALEGKDSTSAPTGKARYATKHGKDKKGERRIESNELYRTHRLNEAEMESQVILEVCESDGLLASPRQLARRLATRLLPFGGGGSTEAEIDSVPSNQVTTRSSQELFLNSLYFSYGMKAIAQKLGIDIKDGKKFLNKKDCNRILGAIGLQGGITQKDGVLDVSRIFRVGLDQGKVVKKSNNKNKRLEIEIGSGFGEWIVKKAKSEPTTNFISVELRADRVGQTFSRTAILAGTTPIDNLCIVGAESGSFLRNCVAKGTISTIFINHPEPPTQMFGAHALNLESICNGGTEPAHMLSSQTLQAIAQCLSKSHDSRLIIVTDNKWYGRLICSTLVKLDCQCKEKFHPVDLSHHFAVTESFRLTTGTVHLYEGRPNASIGHGVFEASTGSTYFDRLWRTGAGTHSAVHSRYVICVSREKA